jgi:hypothetical protein
VVFVREKDVTSIAARATSVLSSHRQYVGAGLPVGDEQAFVLHHHGDHQRHIRIALLIVPIPPKQG